MQKRDAERKADDDSKLTLLGLLKKESEQSGRKDGGGGETEPLSSTPRLTLTDRNPDTTRTQPGYVYVTFLL